MLCGLSKTGRSGIAREDLPEISICELKYRLMDDFIEAVHALNVLHNQQTVAVVEGDQDFSRFDLLLHLAQERKDLAKYAWMTHVESHCCGEGQKEE
jgi:hypothetical protein